MRVNIFDQISAIGGTLGLFTGVSLITFVEGGFQLEFLSISRVINHMTSYKFEWSHWLKLQHSGWRANLIKDLLLNKFSTNESTRIIAGHLIYNPAYTYKFQLKTTLESICQEFSYTISITSCSCEISKNGTNGDLSMYYSNQSF